MREKISKIMMMDEVLKKDFVEHLLVVVGIIICGMYFGMTYGNISIFLVFLVIALCVLLYTYYRLTLCLDEKVVFADGRIVEIYNNVLIKGKLGRNYIVIRQDDVFIRIYIAKVRKYKENNVIRLYFKPSDLQRENDDTFVCHSYFLISK